MRLHLSWIINDSLIIWLISNGHYFVLAAIKHSNSILRDQLDYQNIVALWVSQKNEPAQEVAFIIANFKNFQQKDQSLP